MPDPEIQCDALSWPETLDRDLFRFLTGRVNCRETAADLTQETFLRLHESSLRNPPPNLRALAFRIAENLAIDHQRKTSFRRRYHAEVEDELVAETVPSFEAGPEQTAMTAQRFDRLQSALAELPEPHRAVFLLHSLEGLSYSEIAVRLNISKSLVGKHLAKALSHCARRVGLD